MFGMSTSVGIDLGTANILVYVKGKGIVLREPSVVTVDRDTNSVLAIGEEAREMIGRTPGNIVAIRPLRDGVIADYDMTESMIRHFLDIFQTACNDLHSNRRYRRGEKSSSRGGGAGGREKN